VLLSHPPRDKPRMVPIIVPEGGAENNIIRSMFYVAFKYF